MTPREFLPAPPDIGIAAGSAHVWLAALDVSPQRLGELRRVLTTEEAARADRFVQPPHRAHYAAARGLLRELLGRFLEVDPRAVAFQLNARGKPSLAAAFAASDLRFNLSHSHGHALFAFARGRELGVDIEQMRENFGTLKIAGRFFAPTEAARLSALPAPEQVRGFFECWTRKEAYVKARGDGLTRALDSFEVAFGPDTVPALLHASDEPNATTRWAVFDLPVPQGFAGAIVIERPPCELHCWRLH